MGKRAAGEGSIHWWEAKQMWRAQTPRDVVTGKRRYVSGKTQAAVKKKLDAIERDADAGIITTEVQTLGEWLTYWLENVVRQEKKPLTYQGYERDVRIHLNTTALAKLRLRDLRPEHVKALHASLLKQGQSTGSVGRIHACLKSALGTAVEYNKMGYNPVAGVKPPRNPRKEVVAYNATEAEAILVAAEGEHLELAFLLALDTGLRSGELRGLQWEDIDLTGDEPAIHVRHNLIEIYAKGEGREHRLDTPKSATSVRTVPLTPRAALALREHRLATGRPESGYVLTAKRGGPVLAPVFTQAWYRVRDRANVPAHKLHALRATFASGLAKEGVPIEDTAALLGHSDISITARYYLKTDKASLRKAVAALANRAV